MLKADIAWSDLSHNPEWNQDAIVLGHGRIIPYRHASLETLLIRNESRWFAMVRERSANSDSSATTTVETVDAERFEQLYRSCLLWPLDYVMIEVAQAGRRIKLRAGLLGAAPVYCRATDERVTLSWDFADFLGQGLQLDMEVASYRLALDVAYSARQICVGVTLLTERAVLSLEPGKARHQYPPAFEVPAPLPAQADDDAAAAFGELLRRILTMRPMAAGRIATELSGGMDSATVACALTALHGPVTSRGILLQGDCREPQDERRRRMVARLGLLDETVDIEAWPPSLDLRPEIRKEYAHPEYYLQAFEALWRGMRAQGCDLIFTGLGGDELFLPLRDQAQADIESDREVIQARAYAERLLTPRAAGTARSMRIGDAPSGPAPAVPAGACHAPHLLRHGLWPVNPLSDPHLVNFCLRLPAAQRRGRETMRRYLRAHLGDEVFPRRYVKETFAEVFPVLIARQRDIIAGQLKECALADLGLVDHPAALALLDEAAATRAVIPASALVNFLWLERLVRQL